MSLTTGTQAEGQATSYSIGTVAAMKTSELNPAADSDSELSRRKGAKCSRCRARSESGALFCDQCGHRLSVVEDMDGSERKPRRRRRRRKEERDQEDGQSSGGAWFWAEQCDRPTDTELSRCQGDDPASTTVVDSKPPLKKASTSHPTKCEAMVPALRRVHSFGDQPSKLPPLPLLQNSTTIRPVKPPHHHQPPKTGRATSTTTTTILRTAPEAAAEASSAVLWGSLLTDAIDEFEGKRIILSAELAADEQCMAVLAQQLKVEAATRSKYVVARTTSQVQSKHDDLARKVRMNREKLTLVQDRLQRLHSQQKEATEPQQQQRSRLPSNQDDERRSTAAVLIQRRFRVLLARRLFAAMVRRAYQRVLDPETKQYFYYNPRTQQSQWEPPRVLARAKQQERAQRRRQQPSQQVLTAAATRIQSLYRRRVARRAMRELLATVYEKVYDPESGGYYYYCAHTKTSSWTKPALLRGDDLPSPPPVDAERSRAAATIQRLYRSRATRQFLHDLLRGHIDRHYNADADAWYYFNRRTQQSFWESARHAALSAIVPKSSS